MHLTPPGAATPLILYPQHPASSYLRSQCTSSHAALLRTSCGRDISPPRLPPRYPHPPAFFPCYPLSFNPVTNLSLNPFLIRNPTNITSASPTLLDSLSPLAYSEDVFPSLLPPPSSLPTPSALHPPPSDPSPSPPISGGRPPSLALSCGSLLSSRSYLVYSMPLAASPASYSPLVGSHRPPRPLTVRSRAPTLFPSLLQSARGLPPSSPASNSPPDSFQCLSTYSCPLDDLPKPALFITICPTHSHAFRTYNCPLDALLILAQRITIRAIHSHSFPAHRLAHHYCLTIPDPFGMRNFI